ncbi:MAG TPA: 50S ribosomal protein L29 [Anaerolineae bacterium]|nr:50S ribosomal protein L29 [Anaerolineae bacterium]MCB0180658.1 50S ribosomal protein L29 [Anaerolineae bacterium]MCB0225968.1 50S ribosomal protein L29 [Anaerolineae bacterium]MCB9103177.1 50S ribosomal protein L29 [Anaerolineales bacterium]HRV91224.1 50S ribosomal protein L29 [Anaerolineae bacterium]
MKAFEIRNLSDKEIQTKIEEVSEEMFNLRFQLSIGQLKDPSRVSVLKRDVARLKTILRERQLAAQ